MFFRKIPEPQPPYLFRATMFGGQKKTAIRDRTGTFIEPRWDPDESRGDNVTSTLRGTDTELIPSKQYQLALRVELRVEIQALVIVSADVRQRSTMSDMVSPVSMACSLSDCTKSAGSLN